MFTLVRKAEPLPGPLHPLPPGAAGLPERCQQVIQHTFCHDDDQELTLKTFR